MDQTNKAGIIRLMPHELLKMSPADVDTSLVGTAAETPTLEPNASAVFATVVDGVQ